MINIDNNYCENMPFIGSKHVLFSETDDNNSLFTRCHVNNLVISTIRSGNTYLFFMQIKKFRHFADCWILLEDVYIYIGQRIAGKQVGSSLIYEGGPKYP